MGVGRAKTVLVTTRNWLDTSDVPRYLSTYGLPNFALPHVNCPMGHPPDRKFTMAMCRAVQQPLISDVPGTLANLLVLSKLTMNSDSLPVQLFLGLQQLI